KTSWRTGPGDVHLADGGVSRRFDPYVFVDGTGWNVAAVQTDGHSRDPVFPDEFSNMQRSLSGTDPLSCFLAYAPVLAHRHSPDETVCPNLGLALNPANHSR